MFTAEVMAAFTYRNGKTCPVVQVPALQNRFVALYESQVPLPVGHSVKIHQRQDGKFILAKANIRTDTWIEKYRPTGPSSIYN